MIDNGKDNSLITTSRYLLCSNFIAGWFAYTRDIISNKIKDDAQQLRPESM